MELSLVLGVLKEGLKLWNSKESNKYIDKIIKLEGEYYDELRKPEGVRSQLYLDKCLLEITTIAKSFVNYSPKK